MMEVLRQRVRIPKNYEIKIKIPKYIPENEIVEVILNSESKEPNHKYTILHLDDNPVFISITEALFLDRKDILYESVLNVQEALRYIEKKQPDLIISGLDMEGTGTIESGIHFIETVNKLYPHLCIFVLSAFHEPEIIKKKLSGKIIHYEVKGSDPKVLVKNIVRFLTEGSVIETT